MDDLVDKASAYATSAHARMNQLRKYTQQAYEVHLRSVASRVATVCDDPVVIAAAWLHDIVEDTPATFEEIARAFGPDVTALVKDLTDVSKPGDGNRAARKALDRRHLAEASARAKTVKLADIIDNCEDICRHDPRFGRLYLTEVRALLAVLREGDSRLFEQAAATLDACAAKLAKSEPPAPAKLAAAPAEHLLAAAVPQGQQSLRLFTDAFSARDVLEPIPSVDSESLASRPACSASPPGAAIIGVRTGGIVTGYLRCAACADGDGSTVHPVDVQQRLPLEAPLTDIIATLSRYACCFITLNGVIVGAVTRADLEKPVVRMWLFGIIILFEMSVVGSIRARYPDESWREHVSEGRLEKALQLQGERRRRGLGADLLDCLQFADKFQLLLNEPEFIAQTGFASASAAKKALKELESLRNNLAHGQDISTHDWAAITRLAQRIQAFSHDSVEPAPKA